MTYLLRTNRQGLPCKRCGETIEDYSTSGLCRKCWNRNRGQNATEKIQSNQYCPVCGTPVVAEGKCVACERGDMGWLATYRTFAGKAEHRYVYERLRGPIPEGYVIHHLNGLKGDNRLVNIVAMPRSDHDTKSIVTELQKRIRELEGRHLWLGE